MVANQSVFSIVLPVVFVGLLSVIVFAVTALAGIVIFFTVPPAVMVFAAASVAGPTGVVIDAWHLSDCRLVSRNAERLLVCMQRRYQLRT
jgi:hypothetical protein